MDKLRKISQKTDFYDVAFKLEKWHIYDYILPRLLL